MAGLVHVSSGWPESPWTVMMLVMVRDTTAASRSVGYPLDQRGGVAAAGMEDR